MPVEHSRAEQRLRVRVQRGQLVDAKRFDLRQHTSKDVRPALPLEGQRYALSVSAYARWVVEMRSGGVESRCPR
jgi:hypothetical protein